MKPGEVLFAIAAALLAIVDLRIDDNRSHPGTVSDEGVRAVLRNYKYSIVNGTTLCTHTGQLVVTASDRAAKLQLFRTEETQPGIQRGGASTSQ